MLFLYLICSCSVGLVSFTVLILAYLKSWWKGLIYIGAFLLTGTVQLIILTYFTYRCVNIPAWYNSWYCMINDGLGSLTVLIVPVLIHELLKVELRRSLNFGFGILALISLACVIFPFFWSVAKDGTSIVSSAIYTVFRFILAGSYVYAFIMTFYHRKTVNNVGERRFYLSAAAILLISASQIIVPLVKTFPENVAVLATGYFYLNALLLKFLVNRYFEFSKPATQNTLDDRVTNREKEVLALLAQGLSNKDIAASLCITETTVKSHIKNIYKKLEVNNRVQLFNKLGSSPGTRLLGDDAPAGEIFKQKAERGVQKPEDFSIDD